MLLIIVCVLVILYYIWDYYRHLAVFPCSAGRCVFVTGCDSGFGRALALRLDQQGSVVFAGCFTETGLAELKQEGTNIVPVHIDVGDTDSIGKAFMEVKEELKGRDLWGVVNNAGIGGIGGPFEFLGRRDIMNTFNINMVGMAEVARIFLPLLKKSRGRLVNMVSMAGRIGLMDMGNYVASKYAMEGFTDVQRRELKLWGIHVSMLTPGLFRTGILNQEAYRKSKRQQWEAAAPHVREQYGEEFFNASVEAMIHVLSEKASTDLSPVLDAYMHALFAVQPRARYICGRDAQVLCFLSLLPAALTDKILEWRTRRPMLPRALSRET